MLSPNKIAAMLAESGNNLSSERLLELLTSCDEAIAADDDKRIKPAWRALSREMGGAKTKASTHLVMAAGNFAAKKCMSFLLGVVDNPAATSDRGWTALMHAAEDGDAELVKIALKRIDPNLKDLNGKTALMIAAKGGMTGCVEALLPHSDHRAVDNNGRNALSWAATKGNPGCVRALLPDSDVWAVDRDGFSAPATAAAGNNEACLAAMLDHCDPESDQSQSAQTQEAVRHAVDCARKNGFERCALLLQGWAAKVEAQALAREIKNAAPKPKAPRAGARSGPKGKTAASQKDPGAPARRRAIRV